MWSRYSLNSSDWLVAKPIEEEEDSTVIDLVFGKGGDHADRRKEWLQLTE